MRIVIDGRELRTSTGRYVERLLHYLQQIDDEHDFIVLLKPADFDGWQPSNPRFEKVVCPHKEFTFAEQLGFRRQIASLKPDLVHFTMTQQPISYRGAVVTTIHDLTTARFTNPAKNRAAFKSKQLVYRRVIVRVARKSKMVITPSKFVKDDVAKYAQVDPAKIVITHEAADKITVDTEPMADLAGKEFLLYVGRSQPHKNLQRLIEAYQELKWSHPDLLLVLVGKLDNNYSILQDFVERKKIGGVIFTDFVSEGKLRWLFEHAKAYVFPSLSEGFGLPGLEAMLYNLPLISSNATCLPEIYRDGALYFDPLNTKGMAEKISLVLDDAKLAQNLAQKGQKVAASYSWQKMAKQTLEVYNQALKIKNT